MKYCLYEFLGVLFFAELIDGRKDVYKDIWSSDNKQELDNFHVINPNRYEIQIYFDEFKTLKQLKSEYPEYFI